MANQDQVRMLQSFINKGDIRGWNSWREENPAEKIDLSGADLRDTDLRDINLSDANLENSDFAGVLLCAANVRNANLYKANLCRADIRNADFSGCNLKEGNIYKADFREASLKNVDLSRSRLWETKFNLADLQDANLANSKLSDAELIGSILKNCDFTNSDLSGANFSRANMENANLKDCDFNGADLSLVNLSGADLERVNLTGVVINDIATDGWIIKNIRCDYIFSDSKKENQVPAGRYFEPGEFEKIYTQYPTLDIDITEGYCIFSPTLLHYAIDSLNETYPDWQIELTQLNKNNLVITSTIKVHKHDVLDICKSNLLNNYNALLQRFQNESDRETLLAELAGSI